jgi:hypothetical protein
MSLAFPMRSGLRRVRGASAVLLAALGAAGCMYSFVGGGLPSHIRTVYVDIFDNSTTDEQLRSEIHRALQEQLPRELGVRLAPQASADAIIRGRISGYDELTVNLDPNTGPRGQVQARQRRLQITFDAEIFDIRDNRAIWKGNSLAAVGDYDPQGETVLTARGEAVTDVVRKVVQGAQSQW